MVYCRGVVAVGVLLSRLLALLARARGGLGAGGLVGGRPLVLFVFFFVVIAVNAICTLQAASGLRNTPPPVSQPSMRYTSTEMAAMQPKLAGTCAPVSGTCTYR